MLSLTSALGLAQGTTASGIQGSVRTVTGEPLDNARVTATHAGTGYGVEVIARRGRFVIQGLESGGPYSVSVRRIGFEPQRLDSIMLGAGISAITDFVLRESATTLDPVRTITGRVAGALLAGGGIATTIDESALRQLPSLNRDLFDFVRLVPQMSTKVGLANGGFSGGGAGFRYNDYLINGISERTLGGSVPFAFAGGRSVPLDAVREYQVLLTPFDARYGDFAGALVNTVTKSGDNQFRGSVFASTRNDDFSGRAPGVVTPYDRQQVALSVGGPIARDRAHFFVAADRQWLLRPAPGPYVGQPADAERPVPVRDSDLARLDAIMSQHGLVAGTAAAVTNQNPLLNVFGRVDVSLPRFSSRLAIWHNYGTGDDDAFTREAIDSYALGSNRTRRTSRTAISALQVHSQFAGGAHNEFILSHRADRAITRPEVHQPLIRVTAPNAAGGLVTISTGTIAIAQGGFIRGSSSTVRNALTVPLRSHLVTVGGHLETFRIQRIGLAGSYGTWTFDSIDSLGAGLASRYEIPIDFGGATVPLTGVEYAFHAGDRWQIHPDLMITVGIRADALRISNDVPYNRLVDSVFARRTDQLPGAPLEWSPRLGLSWTPAGDTLQKVRGGIGIFTGRPPLAWWHSTVTNYGLGVASLGCGALPSDRGAPPAFVADYRQAPTQCAGGGQLPTPVGNVNLLDRELQMVRTLRWSAAYDRRLSRTFSVTGEALVSRGLSDFAFVNLNLLPPTGTDRDGRVMYGTMSAFGIGTPAVRARVFPEVIDVINTSNNRAWQLSATARADVPGRFSGQASYSFTHVRDVETPLRVNTTGRLAWAAARVMSGRHDDMSATISTDDVPHRIVLAGVVSLGRPATSTSLSFTYVGESGRPFTWLAWSATRLGDLNADGSNTNDPIYVPQNAFDVSQIRFSGQLDTPGADNSPAAQAQRERIQQDAFEAFVTSTPCLRRQRGRIMARNSCREPASHTTVATVRQRVPIAGGIDLQLDAFNVLSLLQSDWGRYRIASPALLEHVGQITGTPTGTQSVFRFNTSAPKWTTLVTESSFQLQLAVRYSF